MLLASPGTIPKGRKVTMQWTRDGEDVATCGLHLVSLDGTDVLDFTDDNSAEAEARLTTWWNAIKANFNASLALDRFIWHEFGVGVRKPNPMVRDVAAGAIAGVIDAVSQLPPQVAISHTLKTSRRRQWGRIYLPACDGSFINNGLIETTLVNALRTAFGTFLDGQASAGVPVVVWCPRRSGGPLQYGKDEHTAMLDDPDTSSFALTVDQVQVDDLFDVIESRRFDKPTLRATHTVGA